MLENRLAFDRGRDHLIAINYDTGEVVVVAKRVDFQKATGRDLADLTYVESLTPPGAGGEDIRAWDSLSNSLLELSLGHTTLPVVVDSQ